MTEHLSPVVIDNYHRQKLTPAELLGVGDHLAVCAECRDSVESVLNYGVAGLYAELVKEAAVNQHLNFEQIATYVDGRLTGEERRMIEDHLASCGECPPLVADLRVFRNEIAPDLDREYRPAEDVPRVPSGSIGKRKAAALPASFSKIPLWVYAPALLLLTVVGWMAWRATTKQATSETPITYVSPAPAPSPSINPASPLPPPEMAPLFIQLNDGDSTLTLDTHGRLAGVDQWPSNYRQLAKDALSNQLVERSPLLAGLNRPGSSLMGGDDRQHFAVIEPAGKVILDDRPLFRWSRLGGATGYVVEVYDEKFNRVASSPLLTSNSWTAPPIARGQVYSWQVKANRNGKYLIAPRPPAPQTKFRILDQVAAAEIERVRRDYASSHLLLGLLYARAGLLTEADHEFRILQEANPNSEVARKLLESVSAQRR